MSDRWRVHFKRHCACWDSVPPYLVEMCYITPPPTVSQTGRVFKNNKAKIREEIVSQNLLGLKSEARLEEFFFSFKSRGLLAACVQETWRTGTDTLENGGCLLFLSGLKEMKSNRGEQGVGIALGEHGVAAWKEAGSVLHNDFGGRIIAIRLQLRDARGKLVCIFLVSAYCPIGSSDPEKWEEFLAQLDSCVARKVRGDVLLIGIDSNSSIGTMQRGENPTMTAVGPHGCKHLNPAGERFRTYLEVNGLTAATTYFKKNVYGTWTHPRSKRLHQIDHFITSKSDFCRLTDAGCSKPLVDSDHLAIMCKLKIKARLKKRNPAPRQKLLKLDVTVLNDKSKSAEFCNKVMEKFDNSAGDSDYYTRVSNSMMEAAKEVLPAKPRAQPSWFVAASEKLSKLIEERNNAMIVSFRYKTRSLTQRLRSARKNLKVAVNEAKNAWIKDKWNQLNKRHLLKGTANCWQALGEIKKGLSKTAPAAVKMMTKDDKSKCVSAEENSEVFRAHFEKLFDREPDCTKDFDHFPQLNSSTEIPDLPDDKEIADACRSLKNKAPGDSGLKPELWKALLTDSRTFHLLKSLVLDFWISEVPPKQWMVGLLRILPKKGDLSLPGNYRGIMLLETAYKIVSILLLNRLRPIAESLNYEQQCGFRPGRGCNDAVFTVKMAMKKRREHSKETWILFLDLVKAFDRVPRELLWQLLEKFGVPPKLVRLLKALHKDVIVKFEVEGLEHEVNCTIGVKQGDILGPVLFIIFMAGVMSDWRKITDCPAIVFLSKPDNVITGRRPTAKGTPFELNDSEYADDTAVLFDSRQSAVEYCPLLVNHFRQYGMEIHTGDVRDPEKKSKTEILFVAAPLSTYTDPTTYDNVDLGVIPLGGGRFFPIVAQFCYLGCLLTRDCSDDADVQSRIDKAAGAFGSVRKEVFSNQNVCFGAKLLIYEGLILAILLYGSECWCLTEKLYHKLRLFHARCARSMCRVTRKHTWKHRISTDKLLARVGLRTIESYINRRQLQWAGHVLRMPFERLPRKMLTCWVASSRPRGCPQFTYGRGLYKALRRANIEKNSWTALAMDRDKWRGMILI